MIESLTIFDFTDPLLPLSTCRFIGLANVDGRTMIGIQSHVKPRRLNAFNSMFPGPNHAFIGPIRRANYIHAKHQCWGGFLLKVDAPSRGKGPLARFAVNHPPRGEYNVELSQQPGKHRAVFRTYSKSSSNGNRSGSMHIGHMSELIDMKVSNSRGSVVPIESMQHLI